MNAITQHYRNQLQSVNAQANNDTIEISKRAFDHITKLIGTVQLMRTAQKEYFRTKNTGQLMLAKGYEADVDAYLGDSVFKSPLIVETHNLQSTTHNSFNEDKIGELVQKLVYISNKILQYEEKLKGMDRHESEITVAIHDELSELRYDRTLVINSLIKAKVEFKLFLQRQLSGYNQRLDEALLKPHEREEIAHMANRTVKKIGELDTELKKLREGGANGQ